MGLNKLIHRLRSREYVSLDGEELNRLLSKINFIREGKSYPSTSFFKGHGGTKE